MRLAGQAKMGYYLTPDAVTRRTGRALTRAAGGSSVIRDGDPAVTSIGDAAEDPKELDKQRWDLDYNREKRSEVLPEILWVNYRPPHGVPR